MLPRLSFLLKKVMVCGHHLVTLSLTINKTLKWLSLLPILMQESFWQWQCFDRYIISFFPHLHTPFFPSLRSLVVSVNIKHHVYLLMWSSFLRIYFWWNLCTLHKLLLCQVRVNIGDSGLCRCDVLWTLINCPCLVNCLCALIHHTKRCSLLVGCMSLALI